MVIQTDKETKHIKDRVTKSMNYKGQNRVHQLNVEDTHSSTWAAKRCTRTTNKNCYVLRTNFVI